MIRAGLDAVERWLRRLGNAVMLLLALAVCAQVAARYAFGYSPVWSEELSRLLLVWVVMIGAAVSVRHGTHIRVDVLLAALPARVRRAWFLFVDAMILVLFAVLVVAGIDAVQFNHTMRSLGFQWPMSVLIAAVPLGFALCAVFLVERMMAPADEHPRVAP